MSNLTDRVNASYSGSELPPRRRHRVLLDLQADTVDDIVRALEHLAFSFSRHLERRDG